MSTTTIILIGGGIALLLLLVGVVVTVTSERSLVEERLDRYLDTSTVKPADIIGEEEGAGSIVRDWLNAIVEGSSFGENLAKELARADLKFKAGEYVALVVASGLLTGVFSYYFFDNSILFTLLGAIGGLFIPRLIVKRQQGVRLRNFSNQLPDMLNLMVNGLRAGFSTMQAMEAVSRELPPPINTEFRRVVQEMQLGVSMEKALDNLLRRIPSDDLDLVITAVNVQRDVGGNLAEILETISYTIRERIRIKGEIRALTAQVVYSGRFLSMMPVILSLILWGLNREYMNQFFLEPRACGIGMLVVSGIMVMIGYYVMTRIADIEI